MPKPTVYVSTVCLPAVLKSPTTGGVLRCRSLFGQQLGHVIEHVVGVVVGVAGRVGALVALGARAGAARRVSGQYTGPPLSVRSLVTTVLFRLSLLGSPSVMMMTEDIWQPQHTLRLCEVSGELLERRSGSCSPRRSRTGSGTRRRGGEVVAHVEQRARQRRAGVERQPVDAVDVAGPVGVERAGVRQNLSARGVLRAAAARCSRRCW